MSRRRLPLAVLVVLAAVLAACGGNPQPQTDVTARQDSIEAAEARQDSIARADSIQRARERERMERRREEARRLFDRGIAAVTAGNYDNAREIFRRVIDEYGDTDFASRAGSELARIDKIEVIRERVHFEFDESRITDEAAEVLQRKAELLRQNPELRLTIEGHCDERGSNEYNTALGQRRAQSTVSYLVDLGVPKDMFRTISYGEERPLVDESNEEAWAMNRRAEFVIRNVGEL